MRPVFCFINKHVCNLIDENCSLILNLAKPTLEASKRIKRRISNANNRLDRATHGVDSVTLSESHLIAGNRAT